MTTLLILLPLLQNFAVLIVGIVALVVAHRDARHPASAVAPTVTNNYNGPVTVIHQAQSCCCGRAHTGLEPADAAPRAAAPGVKR